MNNWKHLEIWDICQFLITSATIRPYLFRLIHSTFPDIVILSFSELPANIEIEFIGKLEV